MSKEEPCTACGHDRELHDLVCYCGCAKLNGEHVKPSAERTKEIIAELDARYPPEERVVVVRKKNPN